MSLALLLTHTFSLVCVCVYVVGKQDYFGQFVCLTNLGVVSADMDDLETASQYHLQAVA